MRNGEVISLHYEYGFYGSKGRIFLPLNYLNLHRLNAILMEYNTYVTIEQNRIS
jgi:hypothetical protein